jgi:hypothetical protein
MAVTPSLAGFAAAQRRLRALFGVDATFLIPNSSTWDASEPIDPETGRPYDPFATPASGGGFAQVVKRVSFVSRPLGSTRSAKGELSETPIGHVDESAAALIVDRDDYDAVKSATRVVVNDHEWIIQQFRHDELAGDKRWLAFLFDA